MKHRFVVLISLHVALITPVSPSPVTEEKCKGQEVPITGTLSKNVAFLVPCKSWDVVRNFDA